jgi:hypothetical protein
LQPLSSAVNSESDRYALGDVYDKPLLFENDFVERVYAVIRLDKILRIAHILIAYAPDIEFLYMQYEMWCVARVTMHPNTSDLIPLTNWAIAYNPNQAIAVFSGFAETLWQSVRKLISSGLKKRLN